MNENHSPEEMSSEPLQFSIIPFQNKLTSLIEKLLSEDNFYKEFKHNPYGSFEKEGIHLEPGKTTEQLIKHFLQLREIAILKSLRTGLPIIRVYAPTVSLTRDAHLERDVDVQADMDIRQDTQIDQDSDLISDIGVLQDVQVLEDVDVQAESEIRHDTEVAQGTDIQRDIDTEIDVQLEIQVLQDVDVRAEAEIRHDTEVIQDTDIQRDIDIQLEARLLQEVDVQADRDIRQDTQVVRDIDVHREIDTRIVQDTDVRRDIDVGGEDVRPHFTEDITTEVRPEIHQDEKVSFAGKSSARSDTVEYTHSNWDHSSHTDPLYNAMERSEAGYATTADKGSHAGVDNKFSGVEFRQELISKFSKWALVRPEVMDELRNITFDIFEKSMIADRNLGDIG